MPTNDKTINHNGRTTSRWGYRIGDIEPVRDGGFLIRIYCNFAETVDDLNREATTIMAVLRGTTEEECLHRGYHFYKLACAGEFEQ
jgi:hypothetical protein